MLGVSACTSDPSPRRVAEDLVKTEAASPDQEECMLDVIEDFDREFGLGNLGEDAQSNDVSTAADAEAILDDFEAALAACR